VTGITERGNPQTAPGVRPVVTAILILWFAGLLRAPPGRTFNLACLYNRRIADH
jgi:hypothetical protein